MKIILKYMLVFFLTSISLGAYSQEVVDYAVLQRSLDLIREARDHIDREDYLKAIEFLNEAEKLNNGNADIYVNRALAYMKLNDLDRADADVQKAIQLAEGESDIYYLAGNIYFNEEEYERAIEFYDLAIESTFFSDVKVDLHILYFNRGNAHLNLKQYDDAVADFDQCISLAPALVGAHHNRGIALRHLDRLEEACLDFHVVRALGSTASDKFLEAYCKEIPVDDSMVQAIIKRRPGDPPPGLGPEVLAPDQIFVEDTFYYDGEGKLTTQFRKNFYRVGVYNIAEKVFVGPFEDFLADGKMIAKGEYDSAGNKHGLFRRFDFSGTLTSQGNYDRDTMSGRWEYFYPGGQKEKTVDFKGTDFSIFEYFDEKGKARISNGTGKYKDELSGGVIKMEFEDGKRAGKWSFKGPGLVISETYQEGEFVVGQVSQFGNKSSYSETRFTSGLFNLIIYDLMEEFMVSNEVTRKDYPYLRELPGPPVSNRAPVSGETSTIVEQQPEFPGGMQAFYRFIQLNLRYPKEARRKNIQGRVFVQFVVSKDGAVRDALVVKGIGGGCDEEALRVIRLCPDWNPGIQRGEPVPVQMVLPITFKNAGIIKRN